ncbi:MAG: hypothetical protein COB36_10800 [Alphaproteobacteria bacterium]|nr:MAG: hypothetical protein COB36_10800 [Alphaproteobacteria bacterium]
MICIIEYGESEFVETMEYSDPPEAAMIGRKMLNFLIADTIAEAIKASVSSGWSEVAKKLDTIDAVMPGKYLLTPDHLMLVD